MNYGLTLKAQGRDQTINGLALLPGRSFHPRVWRPAGAPWGTAVACAAQPSGTLWVLVAVTTGSVRTAVPGAYLGNCRHQWSPHYPHPHTTPTGRSRPSSLPSGRSRRLSCKEWTLTDELSRQSRGNIYALWLLSHPPREPMQQDRIRCLGCSVQLAVVKRQSKRTWEAFRVFHQAANSNGPPPPGGNAPVQSIGVPRHSVRFPPYPGTTMLGVSGSPAAPGSVATFCRRGPPRRARLARASSGGRAPARDAWPPGRAHHQIVPDGVVPSTGCSEQSPPRLACAAGVRRRGTKSWPSLLAQYS